MESQVTQALVEDVLLDLSGENFYQQVGTELRYECPFCHHEKNKFYINTDNGCWVCYNCGLQGNLVSLVKQYLGVGYKDAMDYLKDFGYSTSPLEDNDTKPAYHRATVKSVYDELVSLSLKPIVDREKKGSATLSCPPFPTNTKLLADNLRSAEAVPYFSYLHGRNITLQQIIKEKIGYVVHGSFYTERGTPKEINNSIVFTTFDEQHRAIYWSTRSIVPDAYVKSINSPAMDTQYSRKDVVWGLDKVTSTGTSLVIVEGIFNGLTVNQVGAPYRAVATLGKNVTDDQISLILAKAPLLDNIIIYLDDDAHYEASRLADRIISMGYPNKKLLVVDNPAKYRGMDANDLGKALVSKVLMNSAVEYNDLFKLKALV